MSKTLCTSIFLQCLLLLPMLQAASTEVTLQVVRFPERKDVELSLLPTRRIPRASMKAKIKSEEGQSRIELSYDEMKPAVLFAGDVTCYVLWAVNRDGGVENLGELWVRPGRDKDSLKFSTGLRTFALMVTAEPYYQVVQPSELIISWNDVSRNLQAPAQALGFSDFAAAPEYGLESLEAVIYDGKASLDLLQAQKVHEIAGRLGADEHAAAIYREATLTLQQATFMTRGGGARKGAQEYARRSVASSNEAIRVTLRQLEAKELEEKIAARQAEMAMMEKRAAEAEASAKESEAFVADLQEQKAELEARQAEAEKALQASSRELEKIQQQRGEMESSLGALRREQADLKASMTRLQLEQRKLQEEKGALQGRLRQALSHVADTRESARGMIVNLPDILFDVGQAALKPEAKFVIAKLAGILLIMSDLNLRIEGHTDSTGAASTNITLSEKRANSVFDFLVPEGISSTRITAVGYGMERPVADNATSEGRKKNRRVEIIISEGEVQEASAESHTLQLE